MSADDLPKDSQDVEQDSDRQEIEQLLREYPDRGFAQMAAHSRHSLKRIREVAKVLGDNRSDKTSSTARTLWRTRADEE